MKSKELIVALQQKGILPDGYQEKRWEVLNQLDQLFQQYPEYLESLLFDGTTPGDHDDEEGSFVQFIPADDDGFPASLYISAVDLAEPERNEEIRMQILKDFKPLMQQLPRLFLAFQEPLDD